MRKSWLSFTLITVLSLLAVSCAPKVERAPQQTPAASTVAPAGSTSAPATASPEEIAWAKVVAAAKKESRVTVYSYNMVGDVGLTVSQSFEQKYGIRVEIITGGGSALLQRISAEKRMATVVSDVIDANTLQINSLKETGATTTSQEIPVLQEGGAYRVDPWASDAQRHVLIHTITYYPNIVNTDLVKPSDEPRSLRELSLAKWKGRMTAFEPRQNSTLSQAFPVLLSRKLIDVETVRAIGMNDIKFYATGSESPRKVVQGQHALYLLGSTVSMGTLLTEAGTSIPVKALDVQEGTLTTNRAIALIKDSPHPNAAKLLTNWLLSKDGQTVFVKAQGGVPVRKDVPDFTPKALQFTPTRLIVLTQEEEKESAQLLREGWLAKLWGR